jgi:hypothetical protein
MTMRIRIANDLIKRKCSLPVAAAAAAADNHVWPTREASSLHFAVQRAVDHGAVCA